MSYNKEWYQTHKEYMKEYHRTHKVIERLKKKAYYQAHKEAQQAYREAHKKELNTWYRTYRNANINSLGQPKCSIRDKSRYYLKKYGKKIEGYQIHHCCTYNEPYKFIYCSKEMHLMIHDYLREHNIDADSDHYEYIKHLLDDTVVKYNIE